MCLSDETRAFGRNQVMKGFVEHSKACTFFLRAILHVGLLSRGVTSFDVHLKLGNITNNESEKSKSEKKSTFGRLQQ